MNKPSQINLYEAKTQLSSLVERAASGEEIVIAKNGKPMARLVALPAEQPKRQIPWGDLADRLTPEQRKQLCDDIAAPMPDDAIDVWYNSSIFPDEDKPKAAE